MAEPKEHLSVLAYHALGSVMATRELALTMAATIFKDVFGEDNFKTQLPLNLTDGGDRWIIEGSRDADDYPVPEGEFHDGPAIIEILKANCQVLKLMQESY